MSWIIGIEGQTFFCYASRRPPKCIQMLVAWPNGMSCLNIHWNCIGISNSYGLIPMLSPFHFVSRISTAKHLKKRSLWTIDDEVRVSSGWRLQGGLMPAGMEHERYHQKLPILHTHLAFVWSMLKLLSNSYMSQFIADFHIGSGSTGSFPRSADSRTTAKQLDPLDLQTLHVAPGWSFWGKERVKVEAFQVVCCQISIVLLILFWSWEKQHDFARIKRANIYNYLYYIYRDVSSNSIYIWSRDLKKTRVFCSCHSSTTWLSSHFLGMPSTAGKWRW